MGFQGYFPQFYGGNPPTPPPSRDLALIKEIVNEVVVSQVIICMPLLMNKDVPFPRPFDPNRQIANTAKTLITNDRNFPGEKRATSQMQET